MCRYKCRGNGAYVDAPNYTEAADKLFNMEWYENPFARKSTFGRNMIPTVYVRVSRGFAEVKVYKVGDKVGEKWGNKAAKPRRYTLQRIY